MYNKNFLKKIAKLEQVPFSLIENGVKNGTIAVLANTNKDLTSPCAVGTGLKVKINTNLGTSTENLKFENEKKKLQTAIDSGSDAVMDLSVGGNLRKIRNDLMRFSSVPLGTVPLYEIASEVERRKGNIEKMTIDDILDVLIKQAKDGVDFFTIHAGILQNAVKYIRKNKRVGGIVSRGGAILARWMYVNKLENLFYENFDKILEIMKQYNVTMSLGDALRPGAIADSTDDLQIGELRVLGELVKRCRKKGVQAIVEGPGHIRLDEIAKNMRMQKKLCYGAPFYILGPLPTDIAAGYDHIGSAIGGAIAAMAGANFLCVVTPAEHLRLPTVEDIKDGVMASKIAAHSFNLLNFKDDWERNRKLSQYRARRQWEKLYPLTIDPEKARRYRKVEGKISGNACSMCGTFCSIKLSEKCG
ncbi:MAG: phosphomethylpyrimidine synthase ThiC, partial [Candidatus Omnitrophica bacterium]|nr:phosphomethylpyrimidine synthase ThiC [Candidatus Omnitrophota bacterium]